MPRDAAGSPGLVLPYGSDPSQVADVWLPGRPAGSAGARRAPIVMFLHGGFWRASRDRRHLGPAARDLAAAGLVVCTPEFRRVGEAGGGWPGTFDDVATAVTALPPVIEAETGGLADSERIVLAGHSAGGHLALWAAGYLTHGAAGRGPAGQIAGVVSLAGICDLAASYVLGLGGNAVRGLIGGGPEQYASRYAFADPAAMMPAGVPACLIHGTSDESVPWQQSHEHAGRAAAAGDTVSCVLLAGCGHLDLIDPLSAAWPRVRAALWSVAGNPPPRPL